TFPVHFDSLSHESFNGIRHTGEPRAAPHLTIGEDGDSNLPLFLKGGFDRLILSRPQLLQRQTALGILSPVLEQLRGTEQTSNLFSSIAGGHMQISSVILHWHS